ncbi:cation:proton antiporter [Companilactobacillus mishanensis]|uniref:Sodium:proton antiporter n=1 Tax=Companilactobacillus mishanensis TaxID=2486008 RepID=A0A5P0ZKD0_9LACO|nr:cation:proton antiporter [Companilactobacillus mishanensis]MQS53533.1 sodium:proton antiporter [Companilactobacillus mishanensis]
MNIYLSTTAIFLTVAIANLVAKYIKVIPKTYINLLLGIIIACVPMMNSMIMQFDSESFMVFIIAPLLFLDGQKTRSIMVRQKFKDILGTAILLALISAVISLFTVTSVFSLTLPLALILISISTPTDATALDTVREGRKLPGRTEAVLKMESLFNDASGIILLQAAVLWYKTGHLSYTKNIYDFLLSAVGGAVLGMIIAFIIMIIRQKIMRTRWNVNYSNIIIYFLTPIIIYLVSEKLELSGIIAVVSAGLIFNGEVSRTRFSTPRFQNFFNTASDFIADLLNSSVFVILGLAISRIFIEHKSALTDNLDWLYLGIILYVLSLIIRYVYAKFIARNSQIEAVTFSLGGVHGAVTLALAFSLVSQGFSGKIFDLILLVETVVIILSMIVPTIAFKFILDPVLDEDDIELKAKQIRRDMVRVGIAYVESLEISPAVKESVIFDLNDQIQQTTIKDFLSQWRGINNKRYIFTGFQAVEERQILMSAFEEERNFLYDQLDGMALEEAQHIYTVYSEVLVSESMAVENKA